jgi:secondary thiamine-phosphate synthase enzyme
MKVILKQIGIQTRQEEEMVDITEEVKKVVRESGVKEGLVNVLTLHTSTGLTVNEGISCLERDILELLEKLVPQEGDYHHARYLDFDGRLGVNAYCHLRGCLLGINTFFPIHNGEMVIGLRQTIYFVEFDGPQYRSYAVQVLGE